MKSPFPLILAVGFLLGMPGIVFARGVRIWSYQEMLDKSDLVVIATPTATIDTKELIELPGFVGQRVVGVESRLSVSAVLKGDKTLKDFVLHHYRPSAGGRIVPNGPFFLSFVPGDGTTALGPTECNGRCAMPRR